MDADKCRVLLKTIELGSMAAAADALGYTPSGISRAIESLEKEAGFQILQRRNAGLTREGMALLDIMKEIVYWSERFDTQVKALKGVEEGTVIVGTSYAYLYSWLSEIVAGFHKVYPGITVQILERSSSELSALMENRQLDFGLVSKREGRYRWYPLVEDELVALIPVTHPCASVSVVSADIFSKEPYIQIHPGIETDNVRYFNSIGISPQVRFSTNDMYAACAMVRAGLGIALVNRLFTMEHIEGTATISLLPKPCIEFGIILPERDYIAPAAKRFEEYAFAHLDTLKLKIQ
ncbi:MAG: LysR family transcriptional regulator [Eubacterium sp.]|nr:LysR family transcriptional regulator [Eubacterium sp.]